MNYRKSRVIRKEDFYSVIWIIPVTLLFSLSYLCGENIDISVTEALWNRLGGVAAANRQKAIQAMVFTAENLYFMVLFHIFYGNFLIQKLEYSKFYVFIREKKRTKWFIEIILEIAAITFVYTLILIGLQLIICNLKTPFSITLETIRMAALLGNKIFFMLYITTLGMNFLALKLGNAFSFILVYFICLSFIFFAIKMVHMDVVQRNPWLLLLNPFSGLLKDIMYSAIQQIFCFLYSILLVIILIGIGNIAIKHMQSL